MNNTLLEEVISNLSQCVDLLYQENLQLAFRVLMVTLPSLEQVMGQVTDEPIKEELTDKLQEALEAMEQQDNTLLADILEYEVIERLQSIND